MEMLPRVGRIRPTTVLAMVDLPEPDSPTSANVFRRGIEKLTSATAVSVARPSRLKMRLSQGRDTSNWHRRPSTTTIASAPIDLPRIFVMQPAGHVDIAGAKQHGPFQTATFDHDRAARVEGASIWHGVQPRHRT